MSLSQLQKRKEISGDFSNSKRIRVDPEAIVVEDTLSFHEVAHYQVKFLLYMFYYWYGKKELLLILPFKILYLA